MDWEKGPYYARRRQLRFGRPAAQVEFYKALPQDFVTIEGGMYGYERGVGWAFSQKLGDGILLYGAEADHDDGPWVHPDDYSKFNGGSVSPTARAMT